MKRIYTTFLMIMAMAATAFAQDSVNVILAVDMSNETINANGVHVAGSFQDEFAGTTCGEWDAACTELTEATDPALTDVYLVKVRLPRMDYQFKFINDDNFDNGNEEGSGLSADCGVDDGFGNFNRSLALSAASVGQDVDTVIAFVFNTCDATSQVVTSIRDAFKEKVSLSIAPNPFDVSARVEFDNPSFKQYDVVLTSMTGAVVQQMTTNQNSVELNRNNLTAGIYFLSLRGEAGEVATQKVIIR
ncbi:MAG: T9SS type A sorting domain-containing protein [Bacteroidota bacterium]